MPAGVPGEPGALPLRPSPLSASSLASTASSAAPASQSSASAVEIDSLHYADLPLGLISPTIIEHGGTAQHPALTAGRRRYLCYFLHRHLECRLPEVEALAGVALWQQRQRELGKNGGACSGDSGGASSTGGSGGPAVVWEKPFANRPESPFWYAHLPGGDELVAAVATRSMLAKVLLEVWGEGTTLEELQAAVAAHPAEERARWGGPKQSFKFVVETWGCSFTQAQKVDLIEALEPCTGFKGPIDLSAPLNRFWLIVVRSTGRGLPLLPDRYYFGRQVGAGDRSPLGIYDLRRRRYLGPTSMDTELAFLMCNMAKVRQHSLVLDPFVGTGSVLVPAAHLGALTLGADIDIRVIKIGKKDAAGRPVNIWTNFADYGLPSPLGLLRCDLHTAPFRAGLEEVLDVIVCDPPYGVRAGGKKSVSKDRKIRDPHNYVPSTDPYTVAECLHDLLDCAARLLVLGGRLVYFLPAAPGFYSEEEVPWHPMLALVANCEQILTSRYSRRLIVMEKMKRYDAAEAGAYFEARGPPILSIDNMHDYVYKTPAQLAAEAGMSLAEHRAAQAARMLRNRGKNI